MVPRGYPQALWAFVHLSVSKLKKLILMSLFAREEGQPGGTASQRGMGSVLALTLREASFTVDSDSTWLPGWPGPPLSLRRAVAWLSGRLSGVLLCGSDSTCGAQPPGPRAPEGSHVCRPGYRLLFPLHLRGTSPSWGRRAWVPYHKAADFSGGPCNIPAFFFPTGIWHIKWETLWARVYIWWFAGTR